MHGLSPPAHHKARRESARTDRRGHHTVERDGERTGSLRHLELACRMILGCDTFTYPGSGDLNVAPVVMWPLSPR